MKKLMAMTASVTILMSFSLHADEKRIGAKPLDEKFRPNKEWINQFPTTAHLVATGSISKAINSCDATVGVGNFCVVKISPSATGLPLKINRSKTKLVGAKGMPPLKSDAETFIYIGDDSKKIIIEGLNLQGRRVGKKEIYGIIIKGKNIQNILIRNNKIHDFDSDHNAHGIAVYGLGKNNKNGISNIIIEGNQVYSMRTGSSESIAINGNVRHWEIKNNHVYDINNIAIDAIGGEGTSKKRKTKKGRILPGKFDAARFGFIEGNTVENMSTRDNPAYDNKESWAAAIYIDGGHHISVANNIVKNASLGYEVGAENCLVSYQITLTNNSAVGSTFGDLVVGGYAKGGYQKDRDINCDPSNTADADEGHGYVKHITVKDNSFNSTNTKEEVVTLQYRVKKSIIQGTSD
jgi:hypothetical protein